MKQQIDKYYRPTPKKWRKIGDSLLAASTFLTGYAILHEYQILAIAVLFAGAFGKFLTNFYTEE